MNQRIAKLQARLVRLQRKATSLDRANPKVRQALSKLYNLGELDGMDVVGDSEAEKVAFSKIMLARRELVELGDKLYSGQMDTRQEETMYIVMSMLAYYGGKLKGLKHDQGARVANIVAPDPTTVRIFLSEFESGKRRGEDGWDRDLEATSTEKLAEAVSVLKELVLRMDRYVSSSGLAVNENRLANKMSSICSALFYHSGVLQGLKQSG